MSAPEDDPRDEEPDDCSEEEYRKRLDKLIEEGEQDGRENTNNL